MANENYEKTYIKKQENIRILQSHIKGLLKKDFLKNYHTLA